MTTREWGKSIAQGWKRTEEDWIKKRELGLLILNRELNNTQLLINGDSSSKRFILIKNISSKVEKYKSCIFAKQFTLASQLLLLVFDY